jgi:hypothetical protein
VTSRPNICTSRGKPLKRGPFTVGGVDVVEIDHSDLDGAIRAAIGPNLA